MNPRQAHVDLASSGLSSAVLRRIPGDKTWMVKGAVPTLGDDAVVLVTVKAPTRWLAKSAFRRRYASTWIERRPVIFSCVRVVEEARDEDIAEALGEWDRALEANRTR